MKQYFNKALTSIVSLIMAVFIGSCSDDDFSNKPNTIDIDKTIDIIPINGGFKVSWTPDPLDENFVFLNVRLTDQDNQSRIYNVSRYGSNLVTPELTDEDGNKYLNPNEAVTIEIKNLINQEYTLNFYAYNGDNNYISLGSRKATPDDYTQCPPDSILSVNIECKGGKQVIMKWNEHPLMASSSSTTEKIRFKFTNQATNEEVIKEFEPGIRHNTFTMEEAGRYTVEYSTVSTIGKEWIGKNKMNIKVIKYYSIEHWSAEDKRNWTVTGTSVQESEGPYKYLIDGKAHTFWASNWESTDTSYKLYIKLDKVEELVGVILQQRQNCAKPSWHRCVKDFSIYVKENEEDEYPAEPIYTGQLRTNDDPNADDYLDKQEFNFDTSAKVRYICLSLDSPMFPGTSNDTAFCMAEFGTLVKDPSVADE